VYSSSQGRAVRAVRAVRVSVAAPMSECQSQQSIKQQFLTEQGNLSHGEDAAARSVAVPLVSHSRPTRRSLVTVLVRSVTTLLQMGQNRACSLRDMARC